MVHTVIRSAMTRPIALYGAAVLRIGYGFAYLVFLLREFPNREALWGPSAPWSPAMERQFADGRPWYGWVRDWYTALATTSDARFEVEYALAIVVCALMVVGLYTRLTACAFAFVVTAFSARDIYLTDGSENVLILMSLFLVFTACGRRWSLDRRLSPARRPSIARRPSHEPAPQAPQALRELAEVRRRAVTLLHNAAVVVIGCQMCVIYGAAALWKVQGTTWRDGTAMFYVLHTDWFRVWPGLSDFIASHALPMAALAYVTVFAQIGFPFLALSRRPKYVVLVLLLGMHLGIGLLLGLPIFSLVMIVGDAVFLPDAFWQAAARFVRGHVPHHLRATQRPLYENRSV